MATRDSCVNTRDLAVGHQLGFFQGLLNALNGGIDIDNHPSLQSAARSNTKSGKL